MNYREAGPGDAGQIAHLHAANWRHTYRGNLRDEYLDGDVFEERLQVWTARLSDPGAGQVVIVAEDEESICGFICAFGGHDGQWGSFIDNLHVAVGCHGCGAGRRLMSEMGRRLAVQYPSQGVYLKVWVSNPAVKFYERLGGRLTQTITTENPGGGTGDYIRVVWDEPGAIIS